MIDDVKDYKINKSWHFNESVSELDITRISEKFQIPKYLAEILIRRNITHESDIEKFLSGNMFQLASPFLINNMHECVLRIRKAIENKEKIGIYGDRDVDGICSSYILYNLLKTLYGTDNDNIYIELPDDETRYGLSNKKIDKLKNLGIELLITTDCGITNFEEIKYARQIGMDVIITDHHEPQDKLPDTDIIINPKLHDSDYAFRELAGAGVSLRLIEGILFSYNRIFDKTLIFLDIETTGFDLEKDQITEVAAIKVINGVIISEFHKFIEADNNFENSSDDSDFQNAEPLDTVLHDFSAFLEKDSILISHNIKNYDYIFLKKYMSQLNIELDNTFIDTLELSRNMFTEGRHSLEKMAEYFNISNRNINSSADKAIITNKLFWHLFFHKKEEKVRNIIEKSFCIAMIGTIADIMILIDENRIIAREGMKNFKKTIDEMPGLAMLCDKLAIDIENITSECISMRLAPALNAPGRFGKPEITFSLFEASDPENVEPIVNEIIKINEDRKSLGKKNMEEIERQFEEDPEILKMPLILASSDKIRHGVTGIVATRIMKKYNKPAIIFVVEDGTGIGSGRFPMNFPVKEAMESCEELIDTWGGHKTAIGITINEENIPAFRNKINEYIEKNCTKTELTEVINIDMKLKLEDIPILYEIKKKYLEPVGKGNPDPLFLIKELKPEKKINLKNDHIKLVFRDIYNKNIDALGWSMAEEFNHIDLDSGFEMLAKLRKECWKGVESINLIIEAVKCTGS